MAGTVNKVILIGRLGDDIKMHYFDNGNSIGRFSLATNETWKDKEGETKSVTDWHNIVVKNKLSEICAKYLKKGDKVYLEGKIKTRSWESDGQKKYTTEIHVEELTMLGSKSNNNNQNHQSDNTDDDDLPF